MRKYTIVTNQITNEKVLQIDGKDSYCPFTQPIQVQNADGSVGLARFPCSNQCPMFDLDMETVDNGKLILGCSNNGMMMVKFVEPIIEQRIVPVMKIEKS